MNYVYSEEKWFFIILPRLDKAWAGTPLFINLFVCLFCFWRLTRSFFDHKFSAYWKK